MKAAFINSVAGYGSTGRIVYQLSGMTGVQGRIYYGRKQNLTDADVFRISGFGANVRHALKTFAADAHGFANAEETRKMITDLETFRPDLVHLHNLHGYYLNVQVLFDWLRKTGIPVVWTFHDCWPFTGHCAHFDGIGCDKWKTGCEHCSALRQYPPTFNPFGVKKNYARKKEVFGSLPESQMTIVTPSFWLEGLVRESFLSKYPAETIHTGINLSRFKPVETGFRKKESLEKQFVILAVAGSWTKEKGLDDLVRLSQNLKSGQNLVIVGVSEAQKRLFTGVNTVCVSHTDSVEELAGIYSAADVMLNLTYQDTFPTVNLEAQACGLPVVTYNTGGSPESLSPLTGAIAEKGDLERIMEIVGQMQKGELTFDRRRCIQQAHKFTEENMLAAYRALYSRKTGIAL